MNEEFKMPPVISGYDIKRVKTLKCQFVESLISSGVQYRTCGEISAMLNQVIGESENAAHYINQTHMQIAQLRAEVEQSKRDAERYKFFRNKTAGIDGSERGQPDQYFSFPYIPPVSDLMKGSMGQHIDEAIDAAMSAEKGK